MEKGKTSNFDILPSGWICAKHDSGMPVYLHKQTRVVSLTKPYFLGKGSIKVTTPNLEMKKKTCDNLPFRFQHHMVPLSAVPCLSYQLALDEEAGVEVPSLAGKKEIPFWQYQNETKVQLPKRLLFACAS